MQKKIKTSQKTKYQRHEEGFVASVSKLILNVNQNRFEIGSLTNILITKSGGTTYGDSTIERIAQHPKLECSAQQLRRYWDYYRLVTQHGDLSTKYPSLCGSATYQLARLLRAGLTSEQEKEMIIACAAEAAKKVMTVERISQFISARLDELGKLRKPRKKQVPTSVPPQNDQESETPDTQGSVGGQEGLFTGTTASSSQVPRRTTAPAIHKHVNQTEHRQNLVAALREADALIDALVPSGPDHDLAAFLESMVVRLIAAADTLRLPEKKKMAA